MLLTAVCFIMVLLHGMLLLLGAHGEGIIVCVRHMLLLLARAAGDVYCLVAALLSSSLTLHPQELCRMRSALQQIFYRWCQKWDILVAPLPRTTLCTENN